VDKHERAREIRLKKEAARRGYVLVRSMIQKPDLVGYGLYNLIAMGTSNAIFDSNESNRYSADLDTVERWLLHERGDPAP
jgi:hypothetical protein